MDNASYTVIKRSQHALCYHLNCGGKFLTSRFEVSKTFSEVLFADEEREIQIFFQDLCSSIPDSVIHPNWIKIDCLFIMKFACAYLENGEMYPNFGKIVNIFEIQSEIKSEYAVRVQKFELYILIHIFVLTQSNFCLLLLYLM